MHENLTHNIEQYILELLEEEDENVISLRRKELAERFACVPSQINYVLRSRFSPEQGYLIESRRGEHGYIRILRISCESPEEKAEHIDDIIGDAISFKEARRLLEFLQEREFITGRE
ncbi:MAG: CtsR family transcriptional regulator, partial [Synergistaceae bacterium]|nr:CtsR family transcriptional regulator [Synergistaceae bacterium]